MLLDGYISTGRFCMFINGFIDIYNEEQTFDIWKHRVYGKTFAEFRDEITQKPAVQKPVDVKAIVKDSFDILKDFKPHEGVR